MPPSPVKQKAPANGQPVPTPKAGSVLAKARPVSEAVADRVTMLLYGRNRLGKTVLACHFPKPLLLVSCEEATVGGANSVRKVTGVTFVHVKTADEFDALGNELLAAPACAGYKSVVVDSGTALESLILCRIMQWDEPEVMMRVGKQAKVGSEQYIKRSEEMRTSLRRYLRLPANVVVTANEKDHNPPKDQEEARRSPLAKNLPGPSEGRAFGAAMSGGTTTWVQDNVDWICQLYMDQEMKAAPPVTLADGTKMESDPEWTGRYERRLRMSYHPNYAAGARGEYDARRRDVPDYVVGPTPQQMFDNFMKVVRGE